MLNFLKLVKTLLPFLFLQLLGSSSSSTRLKYPELMKASHTRIVHSINQWLKQLNRVKLPQTHQIFAYETYETLSYDSCFLYYKVVPAVRLGYSTPNSWKSLLQCLFLVLLSCSSSSVGLNCPELMKILLQSQFLHLFGSSRSSGWFN